MSEPIACSVLVHSGDIIQKINDFSGLWKSFTKIKSPWLENIRVITDHVSSWRCPVNSFTDVSFIVVV